MKLHVRTAAEHGVNLTTGEAWDGLRVSYRRPGQRRWVSFLLVRGADQKHERSPAAADFFDARRAA